LSKKSATTSTRAVDVVLYAVPPRVLMPPTVMLAIVVTFLIALLVAGIAGVVMHYLTILYDATGQDQRQGTQTNCSEREGYV
jgi:hypothetical protein